MCDLNGLEKKLLALMEGEYSSLTISFNEHAACYRNVSEAIEDGDYDNAGWVSDEEKAAAARMNRAWTLQWYPHTPVGYCSVAASTLDACVKAAFDDQD